MEKEQPSLIVDIQEVVREALKSGVPQIFQAETHPYEIGGNYFIRTVTHHYTGKLVSVFTREIVIEEAAWIPDDGRFNEAICKGKFNEVEPFGKDHKVIIGREAIIDATKVNWPLPKEQK